MVAVLVLQGALAGFEDFKNIAAADLIQGLIFFLLAVPFTWYFALTGTVVAMAISQMAEVLFCVKIILKKARSHGMLIGIKGVWKERRIFWHYGLPSFLTGCMLGPAMTASQAIVTNIPGGVVGLGGYSAAMQWRGIITFAPQAVGRITLPMLAKLKSEDGLDRYTKTLWVNVALNGGIATMGALPIMILSPWILGFYGSNFRQDWDILVILCISAICQSITEIVGRVTLSMGKMWWDFCIHIVWVISLLCVTAWLVPYYGVRGYVWAVTIAYCNHMILNAIAAIVLVSRARKNLESEISNPVR
jgi:O-antigen/teichoic acid export membrane protein